MPSTCETDDADESLGILLSEDANEPILKDPLLQMTETVLFIAASGKTPMKKTEEQESQLENLEENGNKVSESAGKETSTDGKKEPTTSTKSDSTGAAAGSSKLDGKPDEDGKKDDEDPIAGWGKPLGLPSPVRPSTPAKQVKKGEDEQMDTNKVCMFKLKALSV
jgi:hypothetical protein